MQAPCPLVPSGVCCLPFAHPHSQASGPAGRQPSRPLATALPRSPGPAPLLHGALPPRPGSRGCLTSTAGPACSRPATLSCPHQPPRLPGFLSRPRRARPPGCPPEHAVGGCHMGGCQGDKGLCQEMSEDARGQCPCGMAGSGPVGRAAGWAEGPSGGTVTGRREKACPPAAHMLHQATRVRAWEARQGSPAEGRGSLTAEPPLSL